MCHKIYFFEKYFSGPLLSIPDATLFMSIQFLNRFVKKISIFIKKIQSKKYIFWMSKFFDHDFRKFSWKFSKISKSQKFQLEFLLKILRFRKFWKFSWKFSKIVIEKFSHPKKYIFRPEFFMKIDIFFYKPLQKFNWYK